MPESIFFKTPYPNEDTDPWTDEFANFVQQLDNQIFGLLSSAGSVLIPPTTITFNPSNGRLEWNDDFEMPILGSSFFLKIKYGPDGVNRWIDLADGDKLIVTVPLTSSENINANFGKISGKVNPFAGLFIAGVRRGASVYLNLPTKI